MEESRECDSLEDTVETECSDGVSSPSDCGGVSNRGSSGIDAGTDLCVEGAFVDIVKGRMIDHGGDFCISCSSCGSSFRLSHALICFATHGFCVQRSFEK